MNNKLLITKKNIVMSLMYFQKKIKKTKFEFPEPDPHQNEADPKHCTLPIAGNAS